ncbi:hypothetical protein [Salinibaculum rarum]|nr:hypothetical protein [Salinibaculum sp. KK48]
MGSKSVKTTLTRRVTALQMPLDPDSDRTLGGQMALSSFDT